MKFLTLMLISGAVWAALAEPLLRMGDTERRITERGFNFYDRETGRGPLKLSDREAHLVLLVWEAFPNPIPADDLEKKLAAEGFAPADPLAELADLNARAARKLKRHLVRLTDGLVDMDWRPRAMPGYHLVPQDRGVVWRERWVDLSDKQAKLMAAMIDRPWADYPYLEEAGWDRNRARKLAERVNEKLGERALVPIKKTGVWLCAEEI